VYESGAKNKIITDLVWDESGANSLPWLLRFTDLHFVIQARWLVTAGVSFYDSLYDLGSVVETC